VLPQSGLIQKIRGAVVGFEETANLTDYVGIACTQTG
jgi:hypothetical protein